jgi:polysaccharide biosynthesis protein PslL
MQNKMNKSPLTRLQHIDIAKGIGIVIIVFAHNYISSKYNNGALFALAVSASFNMPLFYLLSGVFFKTSESFGLVFRKKFDSIMMPYFVTLLCAALFRFVMQDNFSVRFLLYRIKTILFATGGLIDFSWMALWFLPSLFVTVISFKIFHSLVLSKLNNRAMEIIMVSAILALGYLLIRWDNHYYRYFRETYYGLPWSIDFMPISLFYFALGYYGKQLLIDIYNSDSLNNKVTVISFLIFITLMFYSNAAIDLNRRQYDDLIISTVKALSGIMLIVGLSGLLDKSDFKGIKKFFATLGRLSLIIFIFHGIVQNTTFDFLTSYEVLPKLSAGVVSFVFALSVPIVFYYLVITRIGFIRMIYDPARKKQVPSVETH